MAESDSSSVDVDLFHIQPKLPNTVDVHRSKGFVDLSSHVVTLHSGRFIETDYLK